MPAARTQPIALTLAALLTGAGAMASSLTQPQTSDNATEAPPAIAGPAIPETAAGAKLRLVLGWLNGQALDDPASHFSPEFLQAVPPARLEGVRAQLFGDAQTSLLRIDDVRDQDRLLVTTVALTYADKPNEYLSLLIGVDDAELIQTLLVQPGIGPIDDLPASWDEFDDRLDALPGVIVGGAFELSQDPDNTDVTAVWAREPDHALAMGSAFKLWVLGAAAEQVAAGERAWDDEITMRNDHKSLPSGTMQTAAEGQTFPLSHVATEMIRISDNTATDHLMHVVGREHVEAFARATGADDPRNYPFLTTKEMFQVKLGGDLEARDAFAQADEAERRAMLAPGGAIEQLTPSLVLASAWFTPVLIDRVEWFATPAELAGVMAHLHRLEHGAAGKQVAGCLTANPGLPLDQTVWPTIAYKGGSEPGVLNMTWRLHRDDGRIFCLTFGWNNTERTLDQEKLFVHVFEAAAMLAAWDR
ncbi:MAG: serine hydrolase [Planctomycetota bacterium]